MDHQFKLLVNGELVDGASAFDVINPAIVLDASLDGMRVRIADED